MDSFDGISCLSVEPAKYEKRATERQEVIFQGRMIIWPPAMKALWMPLLGCVLALGIMAAIGVDERVADGLFDPASRSFPWRRDWWTEQALHRGVRDAIVVLGSAALGVALLGERRGRPSAREVGRMVALSLVLCTGVISGLKAVVNRNCPWSYTRWGGQRELGSEPTLFAIGGHDKAFPAGHASGGFSLLVLWFAGRRRSGRHALAGLAVGLAAGTVAGVSQVMRGAHFLSHNVWSGAICWAIAWGVDRVVPHDDAP